jgi:spore coat protein A, manganese oxidase
VLNASISRSYDLALDTGEPLTVIGTDGGLMPHPQPVGNFRIGMAERYEVVIDFAKYRPGQRVVLRNLQPPNNIDFETTHEVMAFRVGSAVSSYANNEVPQDLNPNMNVMGLTEADSMRSRYFRFERGGGRWTINGTTWEDVINSDYEFVVANPGYEDVEIWELENKSGGWFHPVHIHLVDFKVLDRNGKPPLPHERGPKDVVYVGEGEKVRVIMKFENQRGKYMMHCHNLVHEDHDMMTQFAVGDDGGLHHPVRADPCKNLPAAALFTRPRPKDDDNSGKGSGGDNSGQGSNSTSRPLAPKSPKSGRFKKKPKKKSKRCRTVTRKVSSRGKGKPKTKKVKVCKPKATAKKTKRKAAPKRRRTTKRA